MKTAIRSIVLAVLVLVIGSAAFAAPGVHDTVAMRSGRATSNQGTVSTTIPFNLRGTIRVGSGVKPAEPAALDYLDYVVRVHQNR